MKTRLTWNDFFGLRRFGMTPNLDNIRLFCQRLGHPERNFPSVHVGGTNGKGSVVAILDSILRCAGLRVGMYTSPHILNFGERIRVGGEHISDEDVFAFLGDHWDFIQQNRCTFFEVATAMALDAFSRSGVDAAVVEVGLGGTYDATCVVNSLLSIITRVDFDHTDRLGTTLLQIAADKAGIFQPDKPALISDQHPEVISVLKSKATKVGSAFFQAADIAELISLRITTGGISGSANVNSSGRTFRLNDFCLPLSGSFQVENLQTALAGSSLLSDDFKSIDAEAITRGIANVAWPGRLMELRRNPWMVLDVGHNPGAVRGVLQSIRSIWKPQRIIALFSALRHKDIGGMMAILKEEADQGFIVPLSAPDGLNVDEIRKFAARTDWEAEVLPSAEEALTRSLESADRDDLILIIGSHYLAEEVLKIVEYS